MKMTMRDGKIRHTMTEKEHNLVMWSIQNMLQSHASPETSLIIHFKDKIDLTNFILRRNTITLNMALFLW